MPRGFFEESTLVSFAPTSKFPACDECLLYKKCHSPKMPVTGEGKKGILIVGESPGETEDDQGKQFVGKTGRRLERTLRELGINMRTDCWLDNALRCHPRGNRKPTKKEMRFCRPNVNNAIKQLKPNVIITLGEYATRQVISAVWKEGEVDSMTQWAGFKVPSQNPNSWICPTFHPSFVERSEDEENGELILRMWKRHLAEAVKEKYRPWSELPNFEQYVEISFKPEESARRIRQMRREALATGTAVSFDTESNCIKPDTDGALLVCASFSTGQRSIAFPWFKEAATEAKELMRSGIPIVAHNLKHDYQWAKKYGIRIKNPVSCSMNTAHILDNRQGITGLKFQAYVNFGQDSYDDKIKKFMRNKHGKKINQILEEVNIGQLLLYCGVDSLLTSMLHAKQEKEIYG